MRTASREFVHIKEIVQSDKIDLTMHYKLESNALKALLVASPLDQLQAPQAHSWIWMRRAELQCVRIINIIDGAGDHSRIAARRFPGSHDVHSSQHTTRNGLS